MKLDTLANDQSTSLGVLTEEEGIVELTSVKQESWHTQIDKRLFEIEKRLANLEGKNIQSPKSSYTGEVFDGVCACMDILRSGRVPKIQITWLVICVVIYGVVGFLQLNRAIENETTEFKHQKKQYTIDYGDRASENQYEMPYIDFKFRLEPTYEYKEEWEEDPDSLNKTVSYLLQTISNKSAIVWARNNTFTLSIVEAEILQMGYVRKQPSGRIRVKFQDPDPGIGPFAYMFVLTERERSLNGKIRLNEFSINIYKDNVNSWSREMLPITKVESIENIKRTIDLTYQEKVFISSNSEETNHNFETKIAVIDESVRPRFQGDVRLRFIPNLQVAYWTEYVEFGYYDWLGMMGGMLSYVLLAFFQIAYLIAEKCGEPNSLGILPVMSIAYNNRKDINILSMNTRI